MTHPRRVEPGTTYLITRRTLRRHMLLRPDRQTNNLFVYALAVGSQRHGLLVHGFCVMSTHVHLVVTDVRGELPRFLQWFHRIVALALKVHRRWEGTLWDSDKPSVVRLETREAVVEKLAYTLANPVEAGLVGVSREWPGARTTPRDVVGAVQRATLPDVWFNPERRGWPKNVELRIEPPPALRADAETLRHDVATRLEVMEAEARRACSRAGRRVCGTVRAKQVSPFRRAKTAEPARSMNPTFATGGLGRDAWLDAASGVRAFRRAYREALALWRSGVRDAEFPAGTWSMRVHHGASVAVG